MKNAKLSYKGSAVDVVIPLSYKPGIIKFRAPSAPSEHVAISVSVVMAGESIRRTFRNGSMSATATWFFDQIAKATDPDIYSFLPAVWQLTWENVHNMGTKACREEISKIPKTMSPGLVFVSN